MEDGATEQEGERQLRNALAEGHRQSSPQALLKEVAAHHCIPVMQQMAREFWSAVGLGGWILDVGIGYGWHWMRGCADAKIIGVDMSLGNLLLARRLLESAGLEVVLICADAAALPIRDRTISGIWSVQVFQHFPDRVMKRVLAEMERVLQESFVIEIANANPAWLHRIIYRMCGRQLHRRGRIGGMELNRFSAKEWFEVWRHFRGGAVRIDRAYSELFFHPDLRLHPRRYPLRLEHCIGRRFPALAGLFSRQLHMRIASR